MIDRSIEPRISIRAITPKLVTEGEASEVTYRIKNIGNVSLDHAIIYPVLSWGPPEVTQDPLAIGSLQPNDEVSFTTKFTPLRSGYTFFSVGGAYVRVPEKADRIIKSFISGENLVFDGDRSFVFHAVRARSHEEIGERKSVKAAIIALVVVAIFQALEWISRYILKM